MKEDEMGIEDRHDGRRLVREKNQERWRIAVRRDQKDRCKRTEDSEKASDKGRNKETEGEERKRVSTEEESCYK